MRINLSNLFLAAASLCLAGPGLNAQSFKYVADVPFGFHAANTDLKPGKYIFERQPEKSIEVLRSISGSPQLAVANGPQALEGRRSPRLVFRHRGSDYYLAEIWDAEGKGTVVPPSKSEKSLHQTMAYNQSDVVSVYLASMR